MFALELAAFTIGVGECIGAKFLNREARFLKPGAKIGIGVAAIDGCVGEQAHAIVKAESLDRARTGLEGGHLQHGDTAGGEHSPHFAHRFAIFGHAIEHVTAVDEVDASSFERQTPQIQKAIASAADAAAAVAHIVLLRLLAKAAAKTQLGSDVQ
jgi:hypothetical protein